MSDFLAVTIDAAFLARVEAAMKACQRGVGGRDALARAHDILADCYGVIGRLKIFAEKAIVRSEPPAGLKAVREALAPFSGENWLRMSRSLWGDEERLTIIDSCGVTIPDVWTMGDFRRAAEVYAALNLSETVDGK